MGDAALQSSAANASSPTARRGRSAQPALQTTTGERQKLVLKKRDPALGVVTGQAASPPSTVTMAMPTSPRNARVLLSPRNAPIVATSPKHAGASASVLTPASMGTATASLPTSSAGTVVRTGPTTSMGSFQLAEAVTAFKPALQKDPV